MTSSIKEGEITISSKSLRIFQNHTTTYNIILSFFIISSISKCRLLSYTQRLHDISISSIVLPPMHYIIHVRISAPAIFVFHSTYRTPWCTSYQNKPEASLCHGHYLFTFIKSDLASKLSHQVKCTRNKL